MLYYGLFALLIILIVFAALPRSSRSQRPTPRQESRTPSVSTSRRQKQSSRDELTLRLTRRIERDRAHARLVYQLETPPLALISLLRQRAIQLYQEQNDVSYSEAVSTIIELESYTQPAMVTQSLAEQPGADPVVTILLLKAGYVEDALDYFSTSTGASYEEAQDAIAHLQADIASQRDLWLFHQARTPDATIIRFLLSKGHTLIAARYYRDCTDVSLSVAQQAVREYALM